MAKNILKRNKKRHPELVSGSHSRTKKSVLMQFILLAIASAFFFAITFFFRKQAGQFIPVSTAYFIETCMQMVLMVFAFILFSPAFHQGFKIQSARGYMFAALAGVTVVIGVALSYVALKLGLLSKYQAIASPAQIIFAGLLGMIISGEIFSVRQIIGSIIAVAGIILIVLK